MTVYYVCPFNEDRAIGGVRVLYRHVDLLNQAGIPAAVVHGVRGFRCTWFDNDTAVAYPPVVLRPGDVLALPESFAPRLMTVAPGVPKVIVNQNAYNTWDGVPWREDHPYAGSADLLAVVCVSEQNRALLANSFKGLPLVRVTVSVDAELFAGPAPGPRRKRLAYMSRKRPGESNQVLGMLRARGSLAGWDVIELKDLSQARVSEILRTCSLFLSFSEREGFGLPPLEAMASGCFVIGYTGFAAREYFDERYCMEVPEGDIDAYVNIVSEWLQLWDCEDALARAHAASEFARARYSPEEERQSVLQLYDNVLPRAALAGGTGTLGLQDALMPGDLAATRLLYRRLRGASRVLLRGQ